MNKIILDIGIKENRVAIVENDKLSELLVEREDDKKISGNIYIGKVVNILPGMEAAFVDIGLEKNAFLYLKDAIPVELLKKKGNIDGVSIRDILKIGETVLVQIVKEPQGTKGARISKYINIPGRYTVVMPYNTYIGVSRKIRSEKERARLRAVSESALPAGMGCIIRTASEGVSKEDLEEDIRFSVSTFESLLDESEKRNPPKLLYKELDIVQRLARDYIDKSIDKIIVNDREKYEEILDKCKKVSPEYGNRVEFFDDSHDIFGFLGIERMIKNAVDRVVRLENGGYIVIDETEALTSIDVNTGKFIGTKDLEDTVVTMNIEAAREIAKQIRLRNLGGIIIIDFIDMKHKKDDKAVIEALESELQNDRTKTSVLGMTKLGLVEMTRKKTSSRLTSRLLRSCPYCKGNGKINSEEVVVTSIQNEVKRANRNTEVKSMAFKLNHLVKQYIREKKPGFERVLADKYDIEVTLVESKDIFFDEIKIIRMGSKEYVQSYLEQNY